MKTDTPIHILKKIKEAKKKRFKVLDLSCHENEKKLFHIPNEVFELEHLEVLDLSYNELCDVPDSISQLQYLSKLFLSGNKLNIVPYPDPNRF